MGDLARANRAGRVIDCGRRSGYCEERAQQLLAMCERAGDLGIISWG